MAEAYNHQANGSAESAGQALPRYLKELHSQQGIKWVEAFPQALRIMMDMPRADGLSPYRILTGRDRPMGNIPYVTSRACVAATAIMERQRYIEENVHQVLRRVQLRRQRVVNSGRVSRTPFR